MTNAGRMTDTKYRNAPVPVAERRASRSRSHRRSVRSAGAQEQPCTPRRTAAAASGRRNGSSRALLRHPTQTRLWLLPSGPDQVHGASLQRTRPSTPPAERVVLQQLALGGEFGPAVADCGSSRQAGNQGTASAPPSTAGSILPRAAGTRQGRSPAARLGDQLASLTALLGVAQLAGQAVFVCPDKAARFAGKPCHPPLLNFPQDEACMLGGPSLQCTCPGER